MSVLKKRTEPTCRFRGYFKSFLDGGDSAVKVGVTSGEDAAKDTAEKYVGLLVGESLKFRAAKAPNAAGSLLGDGQPAEDIVKRTNRRRRRGRRWRRRQL